MLDVLYIFFKLRINTLRQLIAFAQLWRVTALRAFHCKIFAWKRNGLLSTEFGALSTVPWMGVTKFSLRLVIHNCLLDYSTYFLNLLTRSAKKKILVFLHFELGLPLEKTIDLCNKGACDKNCTISTVEFTRGEGWKLLRAQLGLLSAPFPLHYTFSPGCLFQQSPLYCCSWSNMC